MTYLIIESDTRGELPLYLRELAYTNKKFVELSTNILTKKGKITSQEFYKNGFKYLFDILKNVNSIQQLMEIFETNPLPQIYEIIYNRLVEANIVLYFHNNQFCWFERGNHFSICLKESLSLWNEYQKTKVINIYATFDEKTASSQKSSEDLPKSTSISTNSDCMMKAQILAERLAKFAETNDSIANTKEANKSQVIINPNEKSEKPVKAIQSVNNLPPLNRLANILLNDFKFSETMLNTNNEQATDGGIEFVLQHYLKGIAHIVQPSLSSVSSPFDCDPDKVKQALINYGTAIFGYYDHDNIHQKNGFVAEDGGTLSKPVVMIINTSSAKPKFSTDTQAIGGIHWVTCVILPKQYKMLEKEYKFDSEQIYFIDSLYDNNKLPDTFKNILSNEISYLVISSPGEEELKKNPTLIEQQTTYTHKLKSTFKTPKFVDLISIPQQSCGDDCGFLAVYNVLMIILTGSGDYTKKFQHPRTRNFACKLRTLFPDLTREFIEKNSKGKKDEEKSIKLSTPSQQLIDHGIFKAVVIPDSHTNSISEQPNPAKEIHEKIHQDPQPNL